jgi:hypothetical protein
MSGFRETAGQRFRVTPKNLVPIFVLLVAIPGGVTWLAYRSQVSWLNVSGLISVLTTFIKGRYFRYPKRRTTPIHESEYKLRD